MTISNWFQDKPLIAFDVTTTVDDHIAFNRYHRSLPRERRKRFNGIIAAIVVAPLLALLICGIARLALGGTNCDLNEIFSSHDRAVVYFKVLAGVLLAEATAVVIYLLYWRRNIERSLRRTLAKRPHVNADDDDLCERISHGFYPTGFSVTVEAFAASFYSWVYLERFDELDDHIFLLTATDWYMIPKRQLSPSTILDLRDLIGQVQPQDTTFCRKERRSGGWAGSKSDGSTSKPRAKRSSESKPPGPWN